MKTVQLSRAAAFLALTLASVGSFAATTGGAPPKPMTAEAVSQCRLCHEQTVKAFDTTDHAGLGQSCASCHGDPSEHLAGAIEKGKPGPIQTFKDMKAENVNETCLSCHDKGRQANWHGGLHDRRDVSCTSCHSVHSFKSTHAQLKAKTDSETCLTCHADIRSKGMRVSHHPVREGLMQCASCHDPHDGTKPKMVKGETVNDTCLTCHAEKRGPFLWEHAPVQENCASCHDPHGSNHEKLLVAKQPYICQRCHLNTRHPGTLYDFRNTLTGASPSNRAVEHACKNCHQSVHGGNAPSGPYLGR
jgi:DmsE family decaheme c-type cytochrome